MTLNEEIKKLAEEQGIDCFVKGELDRELFNLKMIWDFISLNQKLSEAFIKEFQDKVNWRYISEYQKLSEAFIKEFQDKVDWENISKSQKLSEEFIKEFQNKVNWYFISVHQKLSEEFIRENKDKLSKEALEIFDLNKGLVKEEIIKRAKMYAEKHGLKTDEEFLYAFREHDMHGRGSFNKTIFYKKGIYYQDWHCDPRPTEENSYGIGIWPKGNTPVKVKLEDFCLAVDREDGKARVYGFETTLS